MIVKFLTKCCMRKITIIFSLIALLTSCAKESNPVILKDIVVTGRADVSERSVTISGNLNIEFSKNDGCQFGILYSENENPSKENGIFVNADELDSNKEFKVHIDHLGYETQYYYKAFLRYASAAYQFGNVMSFKSSKTKLPSGAVDLGLSVYWGAYNIGASKAEEYGCYYQWAGLEDVTGKSFYYTECPYYKHDDKGSGLIKYVLNSYRCYPSYQPDYKTVLEPEDDIAHVRLGGRWRMPTEAECKELFAHCSSEPAVINGVKGRKFTSDLNGNSIFFPQEGRGYDNYGRYWSSSLSPSGETQARSFNIGYDIYGGIATESRHMSKFVRPVSD